MSTLLNQVVAVEKHIKGEVYSTVTKLQHDTQRNLGVFSGITRTYTPLDTEGEKLPSESTRVQMTVTTILNKIADASVRLFDVVATKDFANTAAKADIVVDGEVLIADVPVTYLLFIEKQLRDIRTIIVKLPTLDPAESWTYDPVPACYATAPTDTTRTKKIPQNHILSPATPQHPAQVHMFTEDRVVGTWRTIKFSGALPAERVAVLLARVEALQLAVAYAREKANTLEIENRKVGASVFSYLFAV